MTSEPPTADKVETILKGARTKTAPEDGDLLPVYTFLFAPGPANSGADSISGASSSFTTVPSHFYCSKCPSDLHREAATYLIFLFAFTKKDRAERFIDALERVLKGCTSCAKSFGGVRRSFVKM